MSVSVQGQDDLVPKHEVWDVSCTQKKSGFHYKRIAELSFWIVSWIFHQGFAASNRCCLIETAGSELMLQVWVWLTQRYYNVSPCDLLTLALLPYCLGSHRPCCCTSGLVSLMKETKYRNQHRDLLLHQTQTHFMFYMLYELCTNKYVVIWFA